MTAGVEWLGTYREEGSLRFRVGRRDDLLVAEWIGFATLTAREDGLQHNLAFVEGVSPAMRRKLEKGSASLLLRTLRGELGFHGAAIAFADDAVILVGPRGHGKSTTAAALCARGGRLLADDAVAVGMSEQGIVVEPTEGDHWLDETARMRLALSSSVAGDSKAPVPTRLPAVVAVRACAIVDLVWRDECTVPRATKKGGVDALARVLPHLVRFVLDSPTRNRAELDRLEYLLEHVSVYVLERPRRWDALGSTVDMITDLCLNKGKDR